MSIGLMWLLIIFLIPLVGFYLFRVNAAPVFLSLCLGYVLLAFDSHNASIIAGNLASHNYTFIHVTPTVGTVNLVLLLGPAALSIILQLGSMAKHKRLINVLPSLGVGLFAPILIVPLLPATIMIAIIRTSYWVKLVNNQASIVGFGALIAIAFFWLTVYKHDGPKRHYSKAKQ
jgi:hypothetical protein